MDIGVQAMKVGLIGLGKMGSAMAERLLSVGFDLGIYNRTASKCDALVERGAKRMSSVSDAARHGRVVVTMLENDPALTSVAFDRAGILEALTPGTVHVAMGTHSTELVRKLTVAHDTAGQCFVSAPVLGRPPAAKAGELGIVVGGTPDAVALCRPVLQAMGRRVFEVGADPVAAAAAKIVNNLVLACSIEAMGEGFALGRKCGLSPQSLFQVLTEGLFSGPAHKIYGKIIAEAAYAHEPGFTAGTGMKDILLALAAANASAVPLPSVVICRDRLSSAIARGEEGYDWSVMALEQARVSGLM